MSDEVKKRECQKCGECCRHTFINDIYELDILREPKLATAVIGEIRDEPGRFMLESPCPFLQENRCSIYLTRPNICVAHVPGTNECCPQYDEECADQVRQKPVNIKS